ncbi:MAG: hypothetical protein R3223_10940, partial [Longimicrobiales bacterium]|nr:hypothetical protein [Longimicrobiales bacterium]
AGHRTQFRLHPRRKSLDPMRFSYIDSQGKEIEVDSVESLALRIELGAIKADTRMYDAVADRWAPAEEHPVFRSLSRGEEIEEDEIVAIGQEEAAPAEPEEATEPAEEAAEAAEGPTEDEEAPLEEVAPPEEVASSTEEAEEAEEEKEAEEEPAAVGPSGEDPLGLGFDVSVAEDEIEAAEEEGREAEGGEFPARDESAPEEPAFEGLGTLELEPEETASGGPGAAEEVEAEGGPGEAASRAEEGPQEEPELADESVPEPTWVDEGEALWETEGSEETGGSRTGGHREALEEDLADPRRKMPAWAASPSETAEEVKKEETAPRRDREAEVRRAEIEERTVVPRPAHWDARRRARARRSRLVRVGQVAGVLLLAAGAGYVLFGPTDGLDVEEPTEVVVEPLLPMGQWTAMATAAERAWGDVLDEFRSAIPGYGLPYRPPPSWLEGIYLSNASEYPGVAEYWQGVDETVADLQVREADLYFQYLNRHLERMAAASGDEVGASAAVSAGNVPRLIEVARMEYDRTAPARDSAYQELYGLAAASLELHRFLIEREEDILYEPFTDPSVSRDPVLEAVPVDSILRVEMNENLDRVIDAIVQSGIPRPITTAALFNHLLTELGRIETASDTPPPPDTLES